MAILSAEKISKSYTEKILINQASLYLNEYDKIGIIGVNGTGKSTLLNILSGREIPDEGNISKTPGTRISYLDQDPEMDENLSILEIVFKDSDLDVKQTMEYRAKSILTKLGFVDLNINAKNMSGGEKKRVAIARALVNPCEILILDEPTNHLDSQMVLWLENYLKNYRGVLVMVTHDRYFLDRVTNRIVEIYNGSLFSYDGNYSKFMELKAEREMMDNATARKNRSLYKKELEWMQRGPRARGTKSKSRIERFEELANGKIVNEDKLEVDSVSTRLGRKTIEINNISKSFDGKCLIKNFSHIVLRDARVGIIGKNGCGKSSLVKIITGTLEPDSGEVIRGETVNIGVLSQEWDTPPDEMRVIDYIKNVAEIVVTNDGTITASKMLERFLFPSDIQWNPISKLSGGEKRRLYLLKVLMEAPNILFLDEPTNDLDIETLTILEDYLLSFSGAVITISHDRYFLDKVVDTIFEFRENGELRQYNGGYSDYLEKVEQDSICVSSDKTESKLPKTKIEKPKKLKFSFKEQKEFETIDEDIETLESQITNLENDIARNSSNYDKLAPILVEKEKLEFDLTSKMERWVYLNDLNEIIKSQQ